MIHPPTDWPRLDLYHGVVIPLALAIAGIGLAVAAIALRAARRKP